MCIRLGYHGVALIVNRMNLYGSKMIFWEIVPFLSSITVLDGGFGVNGCLLYRKSSERKFMIPFNKLYNVGNILCL